MSFVEYFLRHKETRKSASLLDFRDLLEMETVGVEDGSQAETRSWCGLRDFISVEEHLGEHFSLFHI